MGPHMPPAMMSVISTLTPSLDRLLGGGFPTGQLSLIYGEASSGKTTLSIQSFSHQRLLQIAGGRDEDACKGILIFLPQSFGEQSRIVESLENYITKKVGLIVMDTVTSLYRVALGKAGGSFGLNRELNRQLAYLAELAAEHNLVVLVTGQVRSKVEGIGWQVEPVARRTLLHWPRVILRLKPTAEQKIKEARLERSPDQAYEQKRCYLEMTQSGLVDFHELNTWSS
ncbi:MAG: ATPase domain-containing protein [Candidatus Bathyarchaeia archaeon]